MGIFGELQKGLMGDASIVQVYEIVNDGLSNGCKHFEIPRESEAPGRNLRSNPSKKVELSLKHLASRYIKPDNKLTQCQKNYPAD